MAYRKSKILVGICTGGTMESQTVTSLVAAMGKTRDEGTTVSLNVQIGGYKAPSMNRLVRAAQDGGFTHLMSIDCDMVFPPDGIIRLLEADKDIVGAPYLVRGNSMSGNERVSTMKIADKNGKKIHTKELPTELDKVWALGLGFTMFKVGVFDKIDAPWFEEYENPDGSYATEDVVICEKAQKVGIEVWANPKIKMGHIGKTTYR